MDPSGAADAAGGGAGFPGAVSAQFGLGRGFFFLCSLSISASLFIPIVLQTRVAHSHESMDRLSNLTFPDARVHSGRLDKPDALDDCLMNIDAAPEKGGSTWAN